MSNTAYITCMAEYEYSDGGFGADYFDIEHCGRSRATISDNIKQMIFKMGKNCKRIIYIERFALGEECRGSGD